MVDELETRIGILDADATMSKKQVKSAEEMMMNVRFYNYNGSPHPSHL